MESARRNYRLGVSSGALLGAGASFININLVIAAFTYQLTASKFLVGLITSLAGAALLFPQLLLSSRIEHQKRKRPLFIVMSALQTLLLAVMVPVMWIAGRHNTALLVALFFLSYVVCRTLEGCAGLTMLDIVGGVIAHNRLGSFFAYQALFGGVLAFLSGFLVLQPILTEIAFPFNYALLMVCATVLTGVGWTLFLFIGEATDHTPAKRRGVWEAIATGARMLMRDRNYLSLLLMRILVIANAVAVAFYVPYGVERLGAIGMSGIFVGFLQGSRLLSSTVWGRLSDVRGSRSCLLWGGVFFVLAPIAALLAPRLPETFRWPIHGASVALDLPLCMYLLALCIFGVALQANLVGRGAFIIEAADPARRPSYIAFQNAVAFPFTFLPAIAGWIIGDSTSGLDYLFLFAVFTGVLTFFAAFRLTEVRKVGGVR